jgi:predicted acylesterase/phospholipase RssA
VSIGAYLAGANWMAAELFKFLRDHPEQRARFRLPSYRIGAISGASAGNVNALLTALQACDAAPARPAESSALWDIWMQVGMEQLMPGHNGDPSLELGLLDRGYLNTVLFNRLRTEFARRPTPGCFIPIAATLSKLVPARLPVNQLMAAQVQRFVTSYSLATEPKPDGSAMRFVLRPPEALIALDTALGKQMSLVSSADAGDELALDEVYRLLKAGSSVAYLFEPIELAYCDAAKAAVNGGCIAQGPTGAPVERARFVDGGAIDNAPLFAAMRLMELRDSLRAAAGSSHRQRDRGTLLVSYEARRRRSGDASDVAIPPLPSAPSGACGTGPDQERCGGMGSLTQFLGGLLASGGQFELQWLARLRARDPSLRALDVDVTTRQSAIAGEHLMNSSAFLARPLREFDFQVGVYDVLHFTARALLCLPEHRQPSDSSGTDRCVIDTLRGLVDRFPLSCQSSLAVDLLLRQEYGIESSEALQEQQLRSTAHCDETSTESRSAHSPIAASSTRSGPLLRGAGACPRSGPILGAMCAEGTLRCFACSGGPVVSRLRESRGRSMRPRCRRRRHCPQASRPSASRIALSGECWTNPSRRSLTCSEPPRSRPVA